MNRFFDTLTVQKSLSKLLLDIPIATIQILFGILLLAFYHSIFIVFGVTLVTILALILKLSSTAGLESSLKESKYKYQVVAWMEEMARVVYSFKFSQGSHLNIQKTDENVTNYLKYRTIHFKILLFQYKTLIAFKVLITAAMLVIGSILLVYQKLTVGEFIAAEIVILMITSSVEKLIASIDSIYDVITSLEKLGLVTDSPLEKDGSIIIEHNNEGIEIGISDLSFDYIDQEKVIQHLNLHIPSNSIYCISGKDNAGKSTLLKLLSGSYSQFEGSIALNHIPIGNYQLESLRNTIGMFNNNQEIFKGTIWENISMGKTNIHANDITTIAKQIGLENFLTNFAEGYDTLLDPMGKRLTSTMRNTILLLRALVGNPKLILMDEPWQGFDSTIKAKVQQALLHQFKNSTILIATNDDTFAQSCTQKIYLEHGTIISKD